MNRASNSLPSSQFSEVDELVCRGIHTICILNGWTIQLRTQENSRLIAAAVPKCILLNLYGPVGVQILQQWYFVIYSEPKNK